MTICPKNQCTGCSACKSLCKANAISFVNSASNSPIAVIDEKACIGCNMCKKICPANNSPDLYSPKACYALWAKDADDQIKSASAGAVASFYKKIISDNGIVFGTRFVNGKLIFDCAKTETEAEAFKSSRYLQADIENTYVKVKELLEQNIKILFVGTPCQISGLKNYLIKPYDNLITVDLICHGIAPSEYFYKYVKEVIGDTSYDNVEFRGKNGQQLAIYNKVGEIIYLKPKHRDLYYFAYAKGLIHRENCYSCQYAGIQRCSDITVGDFWGLDLSTLKNKTLKTSTPSVCFVNSDKGNEFFNEASEYIDFEKRTIEEILPHNKQLTTPCQPHDQRKIFLENYKTYGFSKAVKLTDIGKTVKKENYKFYLLFPYKAIRKLAKIIFRR